VRTLVPTFYSLQDTWTPLKIALVCLLVNAVLNTVLIFPLRHAGLALATSLSSILNLLLVYRRLHSRLKSMDLKRNVMSLMQAFLCSLFMGFSAYFVCSIGDWSGQGQTLQKIVILGMGVAAGIVTYFACSLLLKNEEAFFLVRMVRRKGGFSS
jgi:putative peptidoglycan lipid II flippase